MYIADFLSRHPDGDTGPEGEIIPIAFLLKEMTEQDREELLALVENHSCSECESDKAIPMVTRSQAKKENLEVPQSYPLKGETRRPEKAQTGIIKAKPQTVTNEVPAAAEPVVEPQVDIKQDIPHIHVPPEPRNRLTGEDLREYVMDALNRLPRGKPNKLPKERVDYEGVLKPQPVNIQLGGQLPAYDVDREFTFPDLMPTEDDLKRKSQKLFEYIDNNEIVRKHIPKQAELEKFLENLKEKVIHDYDIPLTIKEMRAEYPNSPYFRDIHKYIEKGYHRYIGKAQNLFKMMCEDFVTIRGVLFKVRYDPLDKG